MLFADDVVLVHETRIGLNRKLELWRQALKSMGLDLVGPYTRCDFSGIG
jgi:hypothetical protein